MRFFMSVTRTRYTVLGLTGRASLIDTVRVGIGRASRRAAAVVSGGGRVIERTPRSVESGARTRMFAGVSGCVIDNGLSNDNTIVTESVSETDCKRVPSESCVKL